MRRLVLFVMLLFWTSIAYSGDPVDCTYCPKKTKADPNPSVQEYKNCGTITQGKVSLSKKHVKQMSFDRYGLTTVLIKGQHYYVKRDGSMLPVITFDNWSDDYSEGLTRSLMDGKIAYYDRNFAQVIAPAYDWGSPFKEGRALVCKGCKIQPLDKDGHASVTGGSWGYIDKKGQEIIPVQYTRKEAERM